MAGATISFTPQLGEQIIDKLPKRGGLLVSEILAIFPDKDRHVIAKILSRLYKAHLVDRRKVNEGLVHAAWRYWRT
ncbi:MAG: hypothetical protein WC455_12765 [Dehalococcoidia bacterium]|jgi:transcription initiation factor IIE alpha subunit